MTTSPDASPAHDASPFAHADGYRAQQMTADHGISAAAYFDTPAAEYGAAREDVALFDRSYRCLFKLSGADRATWLHNLVTNAVTTLDAGAGNYAFACDVKGRIQFDLNILSDKDTLWIDVDRAYHERAWKHLDLYHITEDVDMTDLTPSLTRLGVGGPGFERVAAAVGVENAVAMPDLGHTPLRSDPTVRFVRHDFAGLSGFELILPATDAARWWDQLTALNAKPVGAATAQTLRVAAGIPWPGPDLDHILPAETDQLERAVSFHKGCYLGQEVVERMRSRGALARRLARFSIPDGDGIDCPTPITQEGKRVGTLTSLVPHPVDRKWIGLGYLRTTVTDEPLAVADPPRAIVRDA